MSTEGNSGNSGMSAQDLEQRALEFLAAEYERDGKAGSAEHIRTQPLFPNKARAVRAIAAALRQRQASRSWWTRCEPNATLEDAAEEIGFMREDWQKVGEALGFADFVDPEVIIATITALRQQTVPVDLEQFREAVECLCNGAGSMSSAEWARRDAERKRLLSIIDSAGKVASAEAVAHPAQWRLDDRELNAGRLKALHRGLELARKWSAGTGARGHTDSMVRGMADELRKALSSQDGDYDHQPATVVFRNDGNSEADFIAHHADACTACGGSGHKADQLPAPVVDDAMVDAAIAAQDAHWADDSNYPTRAPRSVKGDARLHDKLARGAMRAALTAALARAQPVPVTASA